jgi:hypothetical protein
MLPEPPQNPYEAPHTQSAPVPFPRPKGLGGFVIWLLTGVSSILSGIVVGVISNGSPLSQVVPVLVLFWGSWTFVKARWEGPGTRAALTLGIAVLFAISYIGIFWATCWGIFMVYR